MTTFVRYDINGTEREDVLSGTVKTTIGEHNSTSNFSLTYRNYNGILSNVFSIGDSVEIWVDDIEITGASSGGSLIGHYKMNGDSNDTSSNANNGTDTDISYVTGKISDGADFNGSSSKIALSNISDYDDLWATGGTVSMWVKQDTSGEAGQGVWILNPLWNFRNNASADPSVMAFQVSWSGGTADWTSSAGQVPVGTFTHIAMTYNGSSTANAPIFYVDGVAVAITEVSAPSGTISSDTGGAITIGNNSGQTRTVDGIMDDVRIYDTVLTSSQIATIFNSGNGTEEVILATKIMNGFIEKKKLSGGQVKNNITISGRDFGAKLQDVSVAPTVFNSTEVSSIINTIIADNVTEITYNQVATSTTPERVTYNHTGVFDAIKRLADQSSHFFFVDTSKVLQFKPVGTTSSGVLLDKTNVTKASWITNRSSVINQVWVYGDKYLSGFGDDFTADGVGSVFTLTHEPVSLNVTVSGVQQIGDVDGLLSSPLSGSNYLTNTQDKTIIFLSGTDLGNSIPGSLDAIKTLYDRKLPIVKFGRDRSSIATNKLREKVINDQNIKDPAEAIALVKATLEQNSSPKIQGTLKIKSTATLIPGETVEVNLPDDEVTSTIYDILEVTYSFTKAKLLADEAITVKVNKKSPDLTDTIKQIIEDIKQLQAGVIDTSQVLTRLEFDAGSVGIKQNWFVKERDIGSSIVFDDTGLFRWDTSGIGSVFWDALSGVAFTITKSGGTF